jgi:hypothetical protein
VVHFVSVSADKAVFEPSERNYMYMLTAGEDVTGKDDASHMQGIVVMRPIRTENILSAIASSRLLTSH